MRLQAGVLEWSAMANKPPQAPSSQPGQPPAIIPANLDEPTLVDVPIPEEITLEDANLADLVAEEERKNK